MSRYDLTIELVMLRFNHLNNSMIKHIEKVRSFHDTHNETDIIVDSLIENCFEDLHWIDINNKEEYQSNKAKYNNDKSKERDRIRTYIDKALDYEAELYELDDSSFETLYRKTFEAIVKTRREKRLLAGQEMDRWSFFNTPRAEADFDFWRQRLISPAQAVALSFGKDPEVVTPDSLLPLPKFYSPFRDAFNMLLEKLELAVIQGQVPERMRFDIFVEWAMKEGEKLHEGMTEKILFPPIESAEYWKEKHDIAQNSLDILRQDPNEMNSQMRGSLYKMILGMAIGRFEHNTVSNSKATSAIKDACNRDGLRIGIDAIRDHLADAARELDFSWEKPITWKGVR